MGFHFRFCALSFFLFLAMTLHSVSTSANDLVALKAKIKRFAPTALTTDISSLSSGNRAALQKLFEAARLMDSIYLRQVWDGNIATLNALVRDKTELGRARLEYFLINMGPWSRLDHNEPFLPGIPARPKAANYYPADMTKEEFTTWVATLPENEQEHARGFFTTIRRNARGALMFVPYSEEYKEFLDPAAELLREAAALTDNTSLKTYLFKRADAFLSNDYYESDLAWMDLDSPLEVTIGPYEVYMDELFNYKASFEAFITLQNNKETQKLKQFSSYLQEIENNLPIDPGYRNPELGSSAPIRVVDELYAGGEAKAGVKTAAFNLPNDERVTREKGSKRVMLKNVQEAKFNTILKPISRIVVDRRQRPLIDFESFFTHILAHELMHGLGPHDLTINGRETTVRQEMKELGSALEEAKADIASLFALQHLIDTGHLDKAMEHPMYVTYLASTFRTVRFGLNEAHGKGMALQCNYLMDEGGIVFNTKRHTFSIDFEKIKPAVRKLTGEIMTIQAEGSYDKARALLDRYGTLRPEMQALLKKLTAIPVDIQPTFPLAQ
jgi:hypothetical protein